MTSRPDPEWSLTLLNGWTLTRQTQRQRVAHRQQRLITALALLGRRPRTFLAGLLWPDSPEAQAAVGLRVSIWHVSHELPGLLDADATNDVSVALSESVSIDAVDLEHQLQTMAEAPSNGSLTYERIRKSDLLPGWYEDWILAEQERFRALRTAALDAVAANELRRGDPAKAAAAATLATGLEPFRESSYRLLIEAQLAAGDLAKALATYRGFAVTLAREFGVNPSTALTSMIEDAVRASGRRNAPGNSPLAPAHASDSPR